MKWHPVTEKQYNDALEVLPPVGWHDKGFMIGEAWSHRSCNITGDFRATFSAYASLRDGEWLNCDEPLTVAEFKALTATQIIEGIAQ